MRDHLCRSGCLRQVLQCLVCLCRTDLCFHVVKGNEVVNPDEALRTIRRIESDKEVTELYQKYSVEGVGVSQLSHHNCTGCAICDVAVLQATIQAV